MSTLNNKTREICLIGILAAVNIASRVALQALPNFKPVTSIIIISVMLFGLGFGVKLSIDDKVIARARATSKKKAEEKASQRAYFAFQAKMNRR